MKTVWNIFLLAAFISTISFADGLMRPSDKTYPNDFLRHRMTKIDVVITGQIAQTTVYQEFVNEWNKATDVVYSFPLPPDARATGLYFWVGDTMYRAVLKVKEQATNPGTGEGGIDAQVNAYLGPNAIRMMIPGVPAGEIQRVQIEYISICNFHQGITEYRYPLNTSDFVLFPVETFILNINVSSSQPIVASSLQPTMGAQSNQDGPNHLSLSAEKSKSYLNNDFLFTYNSTHDSLNTEFYPVDNDTMDGHFVMVMKSPSGGYGNDVFKKNIVFIVDRSSDMFGATLQEAKTAIGECVKKLNAEDSFNIITFDYYVTQWKPSLVKATQTAKDSAVQFLSGISFSYGSALLTSIQNAIDQFSSDTNQNIIVLFSDGKAVANPEQIRTYNTKKAAIMTIAGATTAGRQRLEMISYLNYGIPAFISKSEILKDRVLGIFDQINLPVLKDVHYEIGTNVHSILPAIASSLYKGSLLYFTGRYKNPGNSIFSIAGFSPGGAVFYDIPLAFPSDSIKNKFAETFWAKEKIDEIERRIAVFGENDSLKKAVIALSLGYGIRCKYTSYNAEKTNPVIPPGGSAAAVEIVEFTSTSVELNSEGATIRWNISENSLVKEFNIYRREKGSDNFELIAVVNNTVRSFIDRDIADNETMYRIEAVTSTGKLYSITITFGSQLPSSIVLYSNYPNPFNPTTTIRYEIPFKQHVTLVVHDVTGKEIVRLVDEQKESGTYTLLFNAHSLTSGVYFYTLHARSFVQTKKMIIVK
ncbi:MAG: VIT domain-containing protein [Bacteroidota bacterium]|nr:VIT domain-containing protein [Bacteroidota bacterium]